MEMQRLHKATKKIFDQSSKKMCRITKKSQPVPPISATKKMNVSFDTNSALLNKRDRCTLCDRKKNQNANLFVLNVANMYVLNT